MNQTLSQLKLLGITGAPPSIDTLLNGSLYAAVLDSVPAHLSIIIQALRSNIYAGNTCVLVTQMTPDLFLSRTAASGADFSDDIKQNRLYLLSQEGDYASNIFRFGVRRFLQEFDYFEIPKESFILFEQAKTLFTLSDKNTAQTQAMDYRDWMRTTGNTSLFLFNAKGEKIPQSILSSFDGVARISQNKTVIELLVDFWYSQDGVIAAKAFPVALDTTGLLRIVPALPQDANEKSRTENDDDHNNVFYFGPDFDSFSAALHHAGKWMQAQSFVDLIHLSRDAERATIVISLSSNSDLQHAAKMVHYLRLNRGNRLKIVIRECGFSLRYLNELFLLRFGANMVIHQQISRQQLPLLWEMLDGQIYTRKIKKNFDQTHSSILSSSYKGYVDLVTFCNESLGMFERGDILDIPLLLILADYHENASPPDILSQIIVERNGDVFSSDARHCYIFIHACAEENGAAALSRITGGKQALLFHTISFITTKETIHKTLQHLVQSGNIALAPDFSGAIAKLNRGNKLPDANKGSTKIHTPPELPISGSKTAAINATPAPSQSKDTQTAGYTGINQTPNRENLTETFGIHGDLATMINRLPPNNPVNESMRWSRK